MARPLHEPLSGGELKNNYMSVAELKLTLALVGRMEHRQLHLPGEPRPLGQEALGKRLDPPVTGRTVRNWLTGATNVPTYHIRQIREMKRRALAALRAESSRPPSGGESQ